MSDLPSLTALARAAGALLDERFQELEAHVGGLITRAADLELEGKAALRRVEMLERRLARAEAQLGGSGETETRG